MKGLLIGQIVEKFFSLVKKFFHDAESRFKKTFKETKFLMKNFRKVYLVADFLYTASTPCQICFKLNNSLTRLISINFSVATNA